MVETRLRRDSATLTSSLNYPHPFTISTTRMRATDNRHFCNRSVHLCVRHILPPTSALMDKSWPSAFRTGSRLKSFQYLRTRLAATPIQIRMMGANGRRRIHDRRLRQSAPETESAMGTSFLSAG